MIYHNFGTSRTENIDTKAAEMYKNAGYRSTGGSRKGVSYGTEPLPMACPLVFLVFVSVG
jgi:hypothetical protein